LDNKNVFKKFIEIEQLLNNKLSIGQQNTFETSESSLDIIWAWYEVVKHDK